MMLVVQAYPVGALVWPSGWAISRTSATRQYLLAGLPVVLGRSGDLEGLRPCALEADWLRVRTPGSSPEGPGCPFEDVWAGFSFTMVVLWEEIRQNDSKFSAVI